MNFITKFIREEDGVTAIEYGLIAALIAVAIIVGAAALGVSLNGIFNRIASCMNTPSGTGNCALVA